MNQLVKLTKKQERLAIGLMSGTCTDGIDAALVKISGAGIHTIVKLIDFITIPYENELRTKLLQIASGHYGGSYEISKMNFLLGKLSSDACLSVCKKANISPSMIDFIGSHGHTISHQPIKEEYFGQKINSTLQIGEAAVISETMNCPVVADFRVRDMAAGGLGAPLVPYSEFLLYSEAGQNVALQNIGGIGNITFLPASGDMEHTLAFDTGPGNMIIDSLVSLYTNMQQTYDDGGKIAASGTVHEKLLEWLLNDPYIYAKPPKTTGREYYGTEFVEKLCEKAASYQLSYPDIIATATMFTAKAIEINVLQNLPDKSLPDKLIVGGGGSQNNTLMNFIAKCLPRCKVMTNEDIGFDSNAKEAVAFAILANETIFGNTNNVPSATGASHAVVMGKITI